MLVLHPQYKLQYFRDANWEPEWIVTAEDMLRTQYIAKYHRELDDEDADDESEPVSPNFLSEHVLLISTSRYYLVKKPPERRMYSTPSSRLQPLNLQDLTPRLIGTWQQRPRRSRMFSVGGKNVGRCTPIFRVWR